ncbi:MAG TPA: efflux RND transporter periplasmic adaptor subunit [Candidatus Methylacidiphilales bacterium]|nr:efflux RND transporter periplasmic adaptor subunit [Candidatus Methylacidiphilales bacterium]
MTGARAWWFGGAALLTLAGLSSCGAAPDATKSTADDPKDELTVAVTHPTVADLSRSISLTAEFRPYQDVDLHAKVSGYVRDIYVDVGDHVKQGQVLAVLEVPELEEDQKKAEAAVLTAQQEVQSAQARHEETDQINQRLLSASQSAPGLIAQQDLDTAADKDRAAAADLQAAKQKVAEAQAEEDRERTLADYAKITAPFDGVVTHRYADTGSLIQAGTASNTQSMPLVRLAELKRLRLDFPVPESTVSDVHVGDPVEINVISLGQTFTARVSRFAQSVDDNTRTMLTEVDVENPDFRYTPGMYATAQLTLADKKNALAVPIQCVSTGDNPTVLVLDGQHKVVERPVSVGLETPSMAQILSGLSEQDLVILGSRSSVPVGEIAVPHEVDGGKL